MDDNGIERVARSMCAYLGLDADEKVTCGHGDIETPAERAASGPQTFDVALFVPRWQTYRAEAAKAIAARRAVIDDY